MNCEQELCANWTGEGCACAVFGIEPEIVGERLNPCPDCGEHINADILRTSPDCPHGWEPVETIADGKALAAELGFDAAVTRDGDK